VKAVVVREGLWWDPGEAFWSAQLMASYRCSLSKLEGIWGDIGGSTRVPSSNNSFYGFKLTSKRIPLKSMTWSVPGSATIHETLFPIYQSRETTTLFMETIHAAEAWRYDASLSPRF